MRSRAIAEILAYVDHPTSRGKTVGEIFGTERFAHLLYALVRMERPSVVVELGTGLACTTLLVAQALRENGAGRLFTVDDGSAWPELRPWAAEAHAGTFPDFESFLASLIGRFRLEPFVSHESVYLTGDEHYDPGRPIDMLFADAGDTGALGCVSLLRYYLPRMSGYSSLFIDRASTLNHAFLLLENVAGALNRGRIPASLTAGLDPRRVERAERLVARSRFTLVHLVEPHEGKATPHQNSRAWLRIEPEDVVPANGSVSFFF